ncbi:MIF4G domain-containing protein [Toxoplasma gondii MAS]|uniref:MIF4G domain-containing protein n=2 Tax=Toxoplasma gondii TaxID=5811 RepID=A0A086QR86_TOXGO|nr:MIF4G domain-containing protein [Toxoplasma gondii MAS]PUA88927.1 MIF4G domain-containing protein [Toxoplasma gondii TgCATBr9]
MFSHDGSNVSRPREELRHSGREEDRRRPSLSYAPVHTAPVRGRGGPRGPTRPHVGGPSQALAGHSENPGCPPLLSAAFAAPQHGNVRPSISRGGQAPLERRPSGEETGPGAPHSVAHTNGPFPRASGPPGPAGLAPSGATNGSDRESAQSEEVRTGAPLGASVPAGPFGFHPGPVPSSLCGPPPPSPPGSVGCLRPHLGGDGARGPNGPRGERDGPPLHTGRPSPAPHGGPFVPSGDHERDRVLGVPAGGMGPSNGPSRSVGGAGPGRAFEEHLGGRGGRGGAPLGVTSPEGLGREDAHFPGDRDARPENGPVPSHPRKLRGPPTNSVGGRGHANVDFPGGAPGASQHSGQGLQGNVDQPRGPPHPGDMQLMGPPMHPPFHHGREGPAGLGNDMGPGMRFVMGHPHTSGVAVMPGPGGPHQVGPGGPSGGSPFGQAPPNASGGEPMLGCGPNMSLPSQMMMPQAGSPPPGGPIPSPADAHPGGLRLGPQGPVVGVPGSVVCGVGPMGGPPAAGSSDPGIGLQNAPPGMPGVGQGIRGPPGSNGPLLGMVGPLVGVGPHGVVVGAMGGMGSTSVVNPPPPRRRNVLDIRDPKTGKLVIGGSLLDGAGGFLAGEKEAGAGDDDREGKGDAQAQKQKDEAQAGRKDSEKRPWSGPRQGDGEKPGDSGLKDASCTKTKRGDSAETVPVRALEGAGPAKGKGSEATRSFSPLVEGESRPFGEKKDSNERTDRKKDGEKGASEVRADGSQRRRGSCRQASRGQGQEEGRRGAENSPVAPGEASKQENAAGHKKKDASPAELFEEKSEADSRRSFSGGSGTDETVKTASHGGNANKRERRKSQNSGDSPSLPPFQMQHSLPVPTSRNRSGAANAKRDPAQGQDSACLGLGDNGDSTASARDATLSKEDYANGLKKQTPVEVSQAETPGLTVGSVVLGPAPKRNAAFEKEQHSGAGLIPATSGPGWTAAGSGVDNMSQKGTQQQSKGKGRRGSFTFSIPEEEEPNVSRHSGYGPKRGGNAVPPPPPGGHPASRSGAGGSGSQKSGRDGSASSRYSGENELSLANTPPQPAEYGGFSRASSSNFQEGKGANSPLRGGNVLPASFSTVGSAGRQAGFKGQEDRNVAKKGSPLSAREARGKDGMGPHANPKRPGARADRVAAAAGAQYGQVPSSPLSGPGEKEELQMPLEELNSCRQSSEGFTPPERSDSNASGKHNSQKNGEGRQRRGSYGERGDQMKGPGDRGSVRGGSGADQGERGGNVGAVGFGAAGNNGHKNAAGRGWRAGGKVQGAEGPLSLETKTQQLSANSAATPGPAATPPGPRGVWGPNGRSAGGALMRAHAHAGRGSGLVASSGPLQKTPEKSGTHPGVPVSPGSRGQGQNQRAPMPASETEREGNTGTQGREEASTRRGSTQRPGSSPLVAPSKLPPPGEGEDSDPGICRDAGREGPGRGKDAGPRQRETTPLLRNNGVPLQGPTPRSGGRGGQEGGRGGRDRQLGGPSKMGNNAGGERGLHASGPAGEGKMSMAHSSPALRPRGGPPSGAPGSQGPGERDGRETFSSDFSVSSQSEGRRSEKEGTAPVYPHPPAGPVPHHQPTYEGSGRFVARPHMLVTNERDAKSGNVFAGPPIMTGPAGPLLQGSGSAPPFSGSFVPYKAGPPHNPLLYPGGVAPNAGPQGHSPPFAFPPSYPGGSAPHGMGGPPLPEGSHGLRMFPPQPFPQGVGLEGPGADFMDGRAAQKQGSGPCGMLPEQAGTQGFSGPSATPGEGEASADVPYDTGVAAGNGGMPLVPSSGELSGSNMPSGSPYYFYPPGAGSEVPLAGAPPAGPVPLGMMPHPGSGPQLPFLGQPNQQVNCMQLSGTENANYPERDAPHAPGAELRNGAPSTPGKARETGGMDGEGLPHPVGHLPPQNAFALAAGTVPFGYPPLGSANSNSGRDATLGDPQSGGGVYGQPPVMGVVQPDVQHPPPSDFMSRNATPNLLANPSGPHPHVPFQGSAPQAPFPRGISPELGTGLPHSGVGSSIGPHSRLMQPGLLPPEGMGMGVQGYGPAGSSPQPGKPGGTAAPLEVSPGYVDGTGGGASGSTRGPFGIQGSAGLQSVRGSAATSPRKFHGHQGGQQSESSSCDRRRGNSRRIENQPLKRREGDDSYSRPSSRNGRLRSDVNGPSPARFVGRNQPGSQADSTSTAGPPAPLLSGGGLVSNQGNALGGAGPMDSGSLGAGAYSQPGTNGVDGPAPFLGSAPGCPPSPVYSPSPYVPGYAGMGRGVASAGGFGGLGAEPGLQRGVCLVESASYPGAPMPGGIQSVGAGRGNLYSRLMSQSSGAPGGPAGHGIMCHSESPQRRLRKKVTNVPLTEVRRGSLSSWTEGSRVESEASADCGEALLPSSPGMPPAGMQASSFTGKQTQRQAASGSASGAEEGAAGVEVAAGPCPATPTSASTAPPLLATPGQGQEIRQLDERTETKKPADEGNTEREEGKRSAPSCEDGAQVSSGSSSAPVVAQEEVTGKVAEKQEGRVLLEASAEASAQPEGTASDSREASLAADPSSEDQREKEGRREEHEIPEPTETQEDTPAAEPSSTLEESLQDDTQREGTAEVSAVAFCPGEETREDEKDEHKEEKEEAFVDQQEVDAGEEDEEADAKQTPEEETEQETSRESVLAPARAREDVKGEEAEGPEQTKENVAVSEEAREEEPKETSGLERREPTPPFVPDTENSTKAEVQEEGKLELHGPEARDDEGVATSDSQDVESLRSSGLNSRDGRHQARGGIVHPPPVSAPEERAFYERARGSTAGLVGVSPSSQRDSASCGASVLSDLSPISQTKPGSPSHATFATAPPYDKKQLVGLFLALNGTLSPPECLGRMRCVSPGEAQVGGKRTSGAKDWLASKAHKQGGNAGKSKLGNAGNDRGANAGNAHLLGSSPANTMSGSLFGKGGAQAVKGGLMGRGGRGSGGGDWPHMGGDNFERGAIVERSGSTCSSNGGWRDSAAGNKWREESAALARQNNASQGGIFGAGGTSRGGHQGMGGDTFSRLGGFFSSRPMQSSGNAQHGASMQSSPSRGPEFLLKKQTLDRPQLLRRSINSLLNKMSIEKFVVVAEKIAVEGESLENAEELQMLADLVYAKAVTEPEYSETYADLCQLLKWRSLDFDKEGEEKQLNFNRAFVNRCQEEFEALQGMQALEVTEEERAQCHSEEEVQKLTKKKKDRVLGNMRFIGELYLRKCIAPSVLKAVVTSLVFGDSGDPDVYPDEHFVECLTELLITIGFTLEQQPQSQQMLHEFMGKLQDLQQKANYSKRIIYKIQDVLDLRTRNWTKKVFKERAKSVAQIREDAMRDELMGGAIHLAQEGTYTIVGRRTEVPYAYYLHEQRTIFEKKKAAKKAADAAAGAGSSSSSSSSSAPWPNAPTASGSGASSPLPPTPGQPEPGAIFGASSPSSDSLVPSPPLPGPPSPYNVGAHGGPAFGASAVPPLIAPQAGPGAAGALGASPGSFSGPGGLGAHGLGATGAKGGAGAPPLLGGAPPAFHPVSGHHSLPRFGPVSGPSGGGGGKGLVGPRGGSAGGPGLMNVGAEAAETPPPEPCEPPELKKDVELLCFEFVREDKPFADFWQEWKALKMPSSTAREQFHALCAKAADDSHPERSARYAELFGLIMCEQVRLSATLRQFVDVINLNFLPQLEDMALDNPRVVTLFAVTIGTMVASPNFTKRQEACMPFLQVPASEDVAWDFLHATYEEVKKRVGEESGLKLAFMKSLIETSLRRQFPDQPDFVAEKLAALEA